MTDPPTPFVRTFLATTAIGLVALAAFNGVIDPHADLGTGFLPPLVRLDRGEKLAAAAKHAPCEGVILGSSRTDAIDPKWIQEKTGASTFSFSVGSARAEDELVILRAALHTLKWPLRVVVIGVDLDTLHPLTPMDARLRKPDLRQYLPDYFSPPQPLALPLLTWATTESSLRSLHYALTQYPAPATVMREDGMRSYAHDDRLIAEGKFDADAAVGTAPSEAYAQHMAGYDAPSSDRERALHDLFDECHRANIDVYVMVTAIHDRTRPALLKQFDLDGVHDKIMGFLRNEQKTYGFSLFDASKPSSFDADPKLFYDPTHMRSPNMKKAIDHLFAPEARALQ